MGIGYTKSCSLCAAVKPLEDFSPQSNGPKGRRSACKVCMRDVKKREYAADPLAGVTSTEKSKRFRAENPDYDKKYYKDNREIRLTQKRLCDERYKEKRCEERRQYRLTHPAIFSYYSSQRRAAELRASFPQFNDEIKGFYATRPEGFHVDHIVPLQGKNVCGLHVPWNLQHLPAAENLSKSNKLMENN